MLVKLLLKAHPWLSVYAGEGGEGGTGTGTGEGGTGTGEGGTGTGGAGGAAGAAGAAGGDDDKTPKFSQVQLNKILAEDRRKHQEQVKKTVDQLEAIKAQKGLSDQQVQALEVQITELNNSLLTKEEQAKQELAKKDKEYTGKLESVSKERDDWKSQFTREVTRNQILQASTANKAVRPEQMIELLEPKTRLVPVMAEDKRTVIGHIPKIQFKDKNEKGEEVTLDLTIEETVKRMKELPDRFGNLFESGSNGGLGGNGSTGAAGNTTMAQLANNPQAWRENRAKMGLKKR